jgi:predicted tellurium resistance membrane protein TerC
MDNLTLLRIYLQNWTPNQSIVVAGVVFLFAGTWFFSDRFNNKTNAFVFIFSYLALCIFLFIGYHLAIATIQPPGD